MDPYVGTCTCAFVHGLAIPPTADVREFRLPGVDGYGTILLGLLPGQFELAAIGFVDRDEIGTWLGYMAQQKGPIIRILLDTGQVLSGCTVLQFGMPSVRPAVKPGFPYRCRVEVPLRGVYLQ
jgi:hypothetical protein